MPAVPFKANAARRHRIPKQRHRVTNWAAYDAALRQRGSLTVWFTDAAIAAWRAEPRTTPGGAALLLGAGHHDGPDLASRVPLGPAPDRRPDRLHHRSAWSRSPGSRPYHLEPPGGDLGATATAAK